MKTIQEERLRVLKDYYAMQGFLQTQIDNDFDVVKHVLLLQKLEIKIYELEKKFGFDTYTVTGTQEQ